MIRKTHGADATPFAGLSPEVVLDAAAAAGCDVDGRLFALNSYENRVYQLGKGLGHVPRWDSTGRIAGATPRS